MRTDRRTVLLAGAFGQGNPGDEAILEAFLLHGLRDHHVVVTSSDPAATARTHAVDVVGSAETADVAKVAASARAIVFGGGTIFKLLHESSGRNATDLLQRALTMAAAARVLNKDVCMLGVGAGHVDGAYASMLVRALVRRASLLVLRDEESAQILGDAGVRPPLRVGTDPAWTLLPSSERPEPVRNGQVIVALSHLAGDETLAPRLVDVLAPIAELGYRVALQPWQRNGSATDDDALAGEIAAAMGAVVIDPPRDLRDARDRFAQADLVVACRFHAAMAAAAAGTPLVTYGHEAKLVAIARRMSARCIDPRSSLAIAQATALAALADDGATSDSVDAEVDCAHDCFRLLRLVLGGPDVEAPEDVAGLDLASRPPS